MKWLASVLILALFGLPAVAQVVHAVAKPLDESKSVALVSPLALNEKAPRPDVPPGVVLTSYSSVQKTQMGFICVPWRGWRGGWGGDDAGEEAQFQLRIGRLFLNLRQRAGGRWGGWGGEDGWGAGPGTQPYVFE